MKVVIVANGEIKDYDYTRLILKDCDYILACDGGLKHCLKMGTVPDYIIGDLDSATRDILDIYPDVPVLRFSPEKDQTDLELAVALACDILKENVLGLECKGTVSLVILGGLGGRFDHQLANAHVLAQALERGVNAELRDENTKVRLINNACRLCKQDGILVTLVPLTTTVEGIVTEGLQYSLKDESLSIGFARGVSNQIADEWAVISIKSGLLFVIQVKAD